MQFGPVPLLADRARQLIGEGVRRERESRHITGIELATRAGMSPSKVSKIEHGKVKVSIETVQLIARALDVSDEVLDRWTDLARRVHRPARGSAVVTSVFQQWSALLHNSYRTQFFCRTSLHFMLRSRRDVERWAQAHFEGFAPEVTSWVAQLQSLLWDQSRSFSIVICESVLREIDSDNCDSQLRHLEDLASWSNIEIGTLPASAGISTANCDFVVADGKVVVDAGFHVVSELSVEVTSRYLTLLDAALQAQVMRALLPDPDVTMP